MSKSKWWCLLCQVSQWEVYRRQRTALSKKYHPSSWPMRRQSTMGMLKDVPDLLTNIAICCLFNLQNSTSRQLLCSKPHPRRFSAYNAYHYYCLKKPDRLPEVKHNAGAWSYNCSNFFVITKLYPGGVE